MVKKSSQESKRMSSSAEIPDLMWRAFPPDRHSNRKSWIATVARALGWKHRRTKALFYCEARIVTADEWRTLNERLNAAKQREREHAEWENDQRRAGHRGVGTPLPMGSRENPSLPLASPASAACAPSRRET